MAGTSRRRSWLGNTWVIFIIGLCIGFRLGSFRLMTFPCLDATKEKTLVAPTAATAEPMLGGKPNATSHDLLAVSMEKLYRQVTREQVANFDRDRPIYIDFGLSDGKDTALYLSKGYSAVSVDAYDHWIRLARSKFKSEIAANRLMLFNVGVGTEDMDAMPLYYKDDGAVVASFVRTKACRAMSVNNPKCKHRDVQVVRCESVVKIVDAPAKIMKVDVEMLHHACVRSLHRVDASLLPKTVCWEEHDRPFGSANIPRPITDAKLILGLFELGYRGIKVVMQGPLAAQFYRVSRGTAGAGGGSGTLDPDEMMHYRSYEDNKDGNFDTNWRDVNQIIEQGIFAAGSNRTEIFKYKSRGYYYDICMKLSPNAAQLASLHQQADNFPLGSYANT